MPKPPNKPIRKNSKKPKAKKPKGDKSKKEGKKVMRKSTVTAATVAVLAMLSVFLALPVEADKAHVYPYGALAVDRLSGPDEWSTGITIGGEVTKNPLFLQVHLDVLDILASDEDNVYPWDTNVGAAVGLYKSVELMGIAVSPNGSFTVDRPSGLDRFAVGFDAGLEGAFDNLFLGVNMKWHDILTNEESQVYPWDQTVRVTLGGYLGDAPADDEEENDEEEEDN